METGELYQFGLFRLDVRKRRLLRGDEVIPLTPKEFEVLLTLVENAGRVLEKDELLERVWKETFVEEGTLTRNISWLRKKLASGSGEGGEKFIETLPKRGYRFLPEVTKTGGENLVVIEEQTIQRIQIEETVTLEPLAEELGITQTAAPLPLLPERKEQTRNLRSWLWLVLGLPIAAVIIFSVYRSYTRKNAPGNILASRVAPFSGLQGQEDAPAFSPDGRQIAFAWNGGEGDNMDVYVKLVSAGEPLQLTHDVHDDLYPVFSPDGRSIAFVRIFPDHDEVVMVPALGGAERKVCSVASSRSSISFSPDGQTMAVVDKDSTGKQLAIFLLNLQNGERRQLTFPPESTRDNTPRFSPNGAQLAFLRSFGDFIQEVFVISTTGGDAHQLTFDKTQVYSVAWSMEGAKVIFVSFRASNQTNLWQLPAAGGEPELIATGSRRMRNMAVSPDGKSLAFVEESEDANIWRIGPGAATRKFIASTRDDHSPNISPDGTRVVFASERTGSGEIWISDADGKNQRQLTNSQNPAGSPRFSSDGRFIVYDAQVAGNSDIFVISSEGGEPRRLTENSERNALPSWSADGKWIYFASNRGGNGYQIWRMPASGGEAEQITKEGGFESFAALDGKEIYYSKGRGVAGLWSIGPEGGNEHPVPELAEAGYWRYWAVTKSGLYYVARTLNPPYRIKFYDFSSGQTREIATTEKSPIWIFPGLSVSQDGKLILFAHNEVETSSIMLAEFGK